MPDVTATPTSAELVLEVVAGPDAGQSFPLSGSGPFTVGRQPGLHVTLAGDASLSRVHCSLQQLAGAVRVTDLGSRGGIFVNGERVRQADVTPTDEVTVGTTTFWVGPPAVARVAGLASTETLTRCGTESGSQHFLVNTPPLIPGYRFEGELGRGGMGVVYRAVREADGEPVAVKTILPAVAPTPLAVGRFCREADILGRLAHPNIVGHRGSGSAGPMLYVVMEFVPGPTAAAVVHRGGPLTPARARHWAGQILDGLAHAHENGFVHRDVKPANLLVVERPDGDVIKVADFGLARAYESSGMSGLTTDGSAGGTPTYMPPEQVTDFKRVRPAADQYSVAGTLFYLLTGRGPYDPARSVGEALQQIVTTNPIPLRPDAPPLPEPFGPLIRRALARDPADRFPNLRAMRRALL